jgi:sec-independent protein translocase protein TatB
VGALDPEKILMILVIALILLGPERLPKVARQLGGAWRELSRYREKLEADVRAAIPDVDLPKLPTTRAGGAAAVAAFLAGLTDTSKPLNGEAATTGEAVTGDMLTEDAAAGGLDAAGVGAAATTTNGTASDAAPANGALKPETSGDVPLGESLTASAERKMQQLAARRAKAIARAESRSATPAATRAGAPATPGGRARPAAPAPVPAPATSPAQMGSGPADSPIGFDDPSMN